MAKSNRKFVRALNAPSEPTQEQLNRAFQLSLANLARSKEMAKDSFDGGLMKSLKSRM